MYICYNVRTECKLTESFVNVCGARFRRSQTMISGTYLIKQQSLLQCSDIRCTPGCLSNHHHHNHHNHHHHHHYRKRKSAHECKTDSSIEFVFSVCIVAVLLMCQDFDLKFYCLEERAQITRLHIIVYASFLTYGFVTAQFVYSCKDTEKGPVVIGDK
uniref:Uncharacterized protein n=1 Tax=Glossina pallidipes TaxID=7398 RepID=A0A1A9ZQG9_GLOPL